VLAKIFSSALVGVDAHLIEVEVDIHRGLPSFTIVGLPETAVRESRERVRAAIKNSGYAFPDDRITINLAPADTKKDGTGYDLPIALGILTATQILPQEALNNFLVMGELSLDGRIKPAVGTLPAAIAAKEHEMECFLVPWHNRQEASVVEGLSVYPVKDLPEVVEFLRGFLIKEPNKIKLQDLFNNRNRCALDFADVKGQEHVKRAMEVAAAGGHNMLMIGSPGSGKTMLARRLSSIMSPMSLAEAIETTKIYSVLGKLKDQALITDRPFRSPHHTISDAGLIGGGHIPKPGEVSLAQNGVLFLDELSEFKKPVLEVLRQPLEDHQVTIARATASITYPASFMFVAAMNPCPCGFLYDARHPCTCSPAQISRFHSKLSGPLLDRIDIHIDVPAVPHNELIDPPDAEPSALIRKRTTAAREIQSKRFKRAFISNNAQMNSRHIQKYCKITASSAQLLSTAIDKLGLSARAYKRILKIARTIADLDSSPQILDPHILEAIQYRSLDRRKNCH
jgi:magnesium chelatase family protein